MRVDGCPASTGPRAVEVSVAVYPRAAPDRRSRRRRWGLADHSRNTCRSLDDQDRALRKDALCHPRGQLARRVGTRHHHRGDLAAARISSGRRPADVADRPAFSYSLPRCYRPPAFGLPCRRRARMRRRSAAQSGKIGHGGVRKYIFINITASRAGKACAGCCYVVARRYSSAGSVICRSGASGLAMRHISSSTSASATRS